MAPGRRVVVRAWAPGRVNLIGDHTDYTGGWVLPMAVDRGTEVALAVGGPEVRLRSDAEPGEAVVPLDVADPSAVEPPWARYVAGVVKVVQPPLGGTGDVSTSLPIGAGLASSAAIEVAVALALGFEGGTRGLALACQRAEHLASGVPSGVMDQLAAAGGVANHALLIDCTSLELVPVPLPDEVDIVVAESGQRRALVTSAYAERRSQCEAAARVVGPLRHASVADLYRLEDPLLVRRARHVITENARVLAFAESLRRGDLSEAGRLMGESHRSLRHDFEVSTPALDALVHRMASAPGVYGARLTGAGFGGCVVALADRRSPVEGWRLKASHGATVDRHDG